MSSFVISLSNFFSSAKCFVLFEVIRLLKFASLLSSSAALVTKLDCFNVAVKLLMLSDVNLLNSAIVIYLS